MLSFMYKHVAQQTDKNSAACGRQGGDIIFDAYTNGDILFTHSLVETLEEVRRLWAASIKAGERRGVMVVGKRTNVDFRASDPLDNDDEVVAKSGLGTLFQNDAEDYFIYSRGSRNWDKMPHFVVGRRAYDNWLVDNSYHDDKMDLIDATNTILALHLTAADGNKAGHKKGADNDHNIHAHNPMTSKSVGAHEWDHGKTDHAHFFTKHKGGSVKMVRRSVNAGSRRVPSAPKPRQR